MKRMGKIPIANRVKMPRPMETTRFFGLQNFPSSFHVGWGRREGDERIWGDKTENLLCGDWSTRRQEVLENKRAFLIC